MRTLKFHFDRIIERRAVFNFKQQNSSTSCNNSNNSNSKDKLPPEQVRPLYLLYIMTTRLYHPHLVIH